MPRSPLAALVACALLALLPASGLAAAPTRPCPGVSGFTCHYLEVPLDRTGTVAGTITLRYATEAGRAPRRKVLIALTGGPGQPGVIFGPSYASGFTDELGGRSLVVLDQRGTGGSSALFCPEVQGIDALAPLFAPDVAGCAERIGPMRDSFASIDTADDIEAIRQDLGVRRVALYGVSYGTWVAQQYARRYPTHVERLVLDSVVPPGDDPWDLRITRALPRVLRDLCSGRACAGITRDAMADLTAVVRRIRARGNLRGTIRTDTGGRRTEALSQVDLLYILVASDLNPYMQARIPAALAAARAGDLVPILRLKHDAAGPSTPLNQFSGGLFVTTTCLDNVPPYDYSDDLAVRAEKSQAALEALPESAFAPFDRPSIDVSSVPQICQHWPDGVYRPESTAPMPAVPTLILSGLADTRTPLEGARTLAAEIPGARIITLRGSGHDVFDSDYTGCVDTALRRFFRDRRIGDPCRRANVRPRMALVPPRRLGGVERVPGLPAGRGRVLRAVAATLDDVAASDNEAYYAGFSDTSGGGLRHGFYDAISARAGQVLILRALEYVPGVRLTGTVVVDGGYIDGSVRVTAPSGLSGRAAFFGRTVVARLGHRTLRTTLGHLARTRVTPTPSPPRLVSRLRLP